MTITEDRPAYEPYVPAPKSAATLRIRARLAAEDAARGTTALAVREPTAVTTRRELVDGEKVLGWARGFLGRFIVWPSGSYLDAAVLWAAHAHARDADGMLVWQSSPRALFSSAEPGSGKSAAMRAVARICPSPAVFTEPSEPAVAHAIGKEHATLFLDEADVLFQTQRKAAIRAIINDGYTPEGSWARVRNGSVDKICTFGALGMAGLDKLDTATSGSMKATVTRCIRWRMRKAPGDYRAPRFDGQARMVASAVTDRLTAFARQELGSLAVAVPEVPEGIGNRAAELWEPLIVMADAAGGRWPDAAREACEEMVLASGMPDDDAEREAQVDDIMNGWGEEL
jgi:hypothetical protein